MPKFLTLVAFLSFAISQSAIAQKNADAAAVKQLVAKNAAKMQFSENDLVNYRVASSYYDQTSGAVIAYLQQTYKGVDVYNALTTVAFKDDKAISVASSKMTELEKIAGQSAAKPVITPVKALQNAASDIQLALNQSFIMPLRQTPDGQEFE